MTQIYGFMAELQSAKQILTKTSDALAPAAPRNKDVSWWR